MTNAEAKNWLKKLYMRTDITDEYGDMEDMQPYEEAVNMTIKSLDILEAEVYNLKQKNKSLEEENKLLKEAVRAGVQDYTACREECIRCVDRRNKK